MTVSTKSDTLGQNRLAKYSGYALVAASLFYGSILPLILKNRSKLSELHYMQEVG